MKIQYNRPNTYSAEGVTLYPGVNVVPDDEAKKFLANAGVASRVKMGAIEVLGDDDVTADDVSDMADIAKLRELAAGDGRLAEVKAARERLAEIDAAANDD